MQSDETLRSSAAEPFLQSTMVNHLKVGYATGRRRRVMSRSEIMTRAYGQILWTKRRAPLLRHVPLAIARSHPHCRGQAVADAIHRLAGRKRILHGELAPG